MQLDMLIDLFCFALLKKVADRAIYQWADKLSLLHQIAAQKTLKR